MIKMIKAVLTIAWLTVTVPLLVIMLMLMFGMFQELILWILK